MQLSKMVKTLRDMHALPDITVRMSGGEESRRIYRFFTRPHSTYKIIQNKRWGVAMLALPETFEEYMSGSDKQMLRRKYKKAKSLGYVFRWCAPLDYVEEMLEINASMAIRQGRQMNPQYLREESVREFFAEVRAMAGVFDGDGVLRAYAHVPIGGDVFLFNRLLGHGDHLENGVMYFLISETLREMIGRRKQQGAPLWAMYDTFLGAGEGLRYFKERLGFKPYRVKWTWGEK